jgi:stage II sporulation protein P
MKNWMKKVAAVVSFGLIGALGIHFQGAVITAAHKTTSFSASLMLLGGEVSQREESVYEESAPAKQAESSHREESSETVSPTPPKGVETGNIQTTTLSLSSANLSADKVHISNKTGLHVNLQEYLNQGLPFSLEQTNQPQVLIVHTHGSEAYTDGDYGYFVKSASTRSTDTTKNTVAVGERLAQVLNEAGIVTINDHTLHDYPNYTGSYTRSADTIQKYLEKYPSIRVVIDGHRDAIGGGDTKVKPTAVVNGKKAAQVMILAGCESGSVENFPNWEENFRFCLQLQKQLETDYPDLARPLLFKSCKYNFDMLNGSVLIEIGTDANTLEEATYSAELLGQALVKILQ